MICLDMHQRWSLTPHTLDSPGIYHLKEQLSCQLSQTTFTCKEKG